MTAGLARAQRNRVVMVLKRNVHLQEAVLIMPDIKFFGALVQNDGPILRDAANIPIAPMVNIKVGVAGFGRFRHNRELDASAVGPAVGPAQEMIVAP